MTTVRRLIEVVERRFGLRFEDATERFERMLGRQRNPDDYVARIDAGDPAELAALAVELTVNETYFYRHAEQFRAFAEAAVPELLATRGLLSVLSAGCSTGEEPYTIAMLLRDVIPARVLGADVNARVLERARNGRYTSWALRAIPPELKARWFTESGTEWVLAKPIRDAVTFEERNLADESDLWAPGRWDVVFCRNVSMYFADHRAQELLLRICRSLVPGGFLFLGHAESVRGRVAEELELCHTHGTFYYRRLRTGPVLTVPPPNDQRWVEDIRAASERVQSLAARAAAVEPVAAVAAQRGEMLRDVRALLTEERYGEALERLAAVPTEVGDRDVLLLRAILYTQRGAEVQARATCQSLLRLDPQHAGAHYLLALSDETIGELVQARSHARRAVELDPTFAMARLHLGLIARRLSDLDAARSELREALARLGHEPDDRLVLFGGGFQRQALVELCRSELAAVTR